MTGTKFGVFACLQGVHGIVEVALGDQKRKKWDALLFALPSQIPPAKKKLDIYRRHILGWH